MGERGSVTVETAIIFPIIIFFISSLITLTVLIYNNQRNKILGARKAYNSLCRRPCEVIRNSEYILEILDKASDLIDGIKLASDLS